MLYLFVTLAVLILAYSLVSKRLESTVVTAPIAFTLGGIAIGSA